MTKYSLVLLLPFVLLAGCTEEVEVGEAPLRSVRFTVIPETNERRVRSFTGVSSSAQEAALSFKVSGTMTSLDVAVGDAVEAGQRIATLETSTYDLQLQQSQAELARSQAEKRNADAVYKRTKGLYENQVASRSELDNSRAAAESAEALVRASSRAVELARLNLSYTRLSAKDSCSVASTSADEGENVNAGQEIVRVNCGDSLNVDISIPESQIGNIIQGMEGRVRFDSLAGREFDAQVVEVGVSASGTTFPVSLSVRDSEGLRSGLAAEVDFIFQNVASYPNVPASAVSEDQQGRFVYLLKETDTAGQGQVSRQQVEVGELTSNGLEVRQGIEAGDKVITAGVSVVRDGLIVKTQ
ncbi:MAG: efflux RND transporter periplasmic adaptor subunit [Pseudomonadota bacterium]